MNLNNLSKNDLNELENYINDRIGKTEPEIIILFQDLRDEKLKDKNVDSDALDFVYDGLTDLVEEWISKHKDIGEELKTSTEKYPNDLENLFNRKLQFDCEQNSQLQSIVEKLLMQNNYPRRSRDIKLLGTQKLNEKFIKDGYIYLLRGAESNQRSGFFAYSYCHFKLNLQEYCKRNPNETPKSLLDKYSEIGKGYFVSATTKLPLTTKFCYKVGDKKRKHLYIKDETR